MTTALIIFSIVLGTVGAAALAAIHFAPAWVKDAVDGYHRLISFDPFR